MSHLVTKKGMGRPERGVPDLTRDSKLPEHLHDVLGPLSGFLDLFHLCYLVDDIFLHSDVEPWERELRANLLGHTANHFLLDDALGPCVPDILRVDLQIGNEYGFRRMPVNNHPRNIVIRDFIRLLDVRIVFEREDLALKDNIPSKPAHEELFFAHRVKHALPVLYRHERVFKTIHLNLIIFGVVLLPSHLARPGAVVSSHGKQEDPLLLQDTGYAFIPYRLRGFLIK